MAPASGINYGWDTNGQSDDAWEGHALARSIVLGAGTHIIQLQALISDPNITFDLDDWSLTVTQYNNGNGDSRCGPSARFGEERPALGHQRKLALSHYGTRKTYEART